MLPATERRNASFFCQWVLALTTLCLSILPLAQAAAPFPPPVCPSSGTARDHLRGKPVRIEGPITVTTRQIMERALAPSSSAPFSRTTMGEATHRLKGPAGPKSRPSPEPMGPNGISKDGPVPVKEYTPATPPSFTAATLEDTRTFPPDTMGAVGPTQFLIAVNGRVRSFNKATMAPDSVLDTTLDGFFGPVLCVTMPCPGPPGDTWTAVGPRVRYDRFTGRWFVVAGTTGAFTPPNRILIAMSDAASGGVISGTTQWTLFWLPVRLVQDPTLPPTVYTLAQPPTFAIDSRSLYLAIDYATGGTPFRSDGYVILKSGLSESTSPSDASATAHLFEQLGYQDLSGNKGIFPPSEPTATTRP